LLAYNAFLTASINSSLSPSKVSVVEPFNILLAAARSLFMAEIHRANTASVIVGVEIPRSSALWLVHFPVPFCPAVSSMTSIIGLPVSGSYLVKMSCVISIR